MSVRRIDQDHTRFRQIVRGRIKKDLKRFVSAGELIGKPVHRLRHAAGAGMDDAESV